MGSAGRGSLCFRAAPYLGGLLEVHPADFPSALHVCSYMLNGEGQLPAYPVREACKALAQADPETDVLLRGQWLGAACGWTRCFLLNFNLDALSPAQACLRLLRSSTTTRAR